MRCQSTFLKKSFFVLEKPAQGPFNSFFHIVRAFRHIAWSSSDRDGSVDLQAAVTIATHSTFCPYWKAMWYIWKVQKRLVSRLWTYFSFSSVWKNNVFWICPKYQYLLYFSGFLWTWVTSWFWVGVGSVDFLCAAAHCWKTGKNKQNFTFSVAVIGFDLISIKEQKISWADLLFYQVFEN